MDSQQPLSKQTLADLLVSAAKDKGEPDWHLATRPQWSAALGFLVLRLPLSQLEAVAAMLKRRFPKEQHIHFIASLTEQAQTLKPVTPFVGAGQRDVIPNFVKESDTAILIFCGRGHRVGFPLPVAHQWFGSLGCHVIYLRDFAENYYFDGVASVEGGFDGMLEHLRGLLATRGVKHIQCFGNSMGSFPAIRTAIALNARRALCCAGSTNLDPEFLMEHEINLARLPVMLMQPEGAIDLRRELLQCASPPQIRIYYGEANRPDQLQAENLRGLKSVELFPFAGVEQHNIVREILLKRQFMDCVKWLVE